MTVNTTVGSTSNNIKLVTYPGVSVSNGKPAITTFTIPSVQVEHISYLPANSFANSWNVVAGDRIWQEQPFWRGGDGNAANNGAFFTISVTAGSNTITANSGTDFTKLFNGGSDPEFLIGHSQNHFGANQDAIFCGKVLSFNSSTVVLDANLNFTNSAAYFYKSTVTTIAQHIRDTFTLNNRNLLMCEGSNANNTLRLTDHTVYNSAIANGGSGYSNTDWVKVTGYEDVACVVGGHYPAKANLQTNSTGGITSVYWSNAGCGFTNTANITVAFFTSSNTASAGTNANLTLTIDAVFRTMRNDAGSRYNVKFAGANLINIPVDGVTPTISIQQPDSGSHSATHSLKYYQKPSTTDFKLTFLAHDNPPAYPIQHGSPTVPPLQFTPCIPSRSNEFKIFTNSCANAINTAANTIPYYQTSTNASVITITAVSTSDNTHCVVNPAGTTITYWRYLINNDYTLEYTNYGNAISKQIEKKVTLANDHFAEDMKVFMTAYRPVGTDFKVYIKLYNSADPDSFDEKNWTLLQDAPQNAGLYSAPSVTVNNLELDYVLGNTPNSDFTLAGTANVTSTGFSNLAGQGTTWSSNATANIQVNDLIKFYQPLFPNNFMISVVTNVHSDTLVTIADPITNNQFLTTPLNVDVIRTYKYQAFQNQLNDNITRYYNQNMVPFDTYNVFQTKVVFLSVTGNTIANTNEYLPQVPYIDDFEAVAVSV